MDCFGLYRPYYAGIWYILDDYVAHRDERLQHIDGDSDSSEQLDAGAFIYYRLQHRKRLVGEKATNEVGEVTLVHCTIINCCSDSSRRHRFIHREYHYHRHCRVDAGTRILIRMWRKFYDAANGGIVGRIDLNEVLKM